MSTTVKPRRGLIRGVAAVGALTGVALLASCVPETPPGTTVPPTTAPPEAPSIWGYTKESLDTGVRHGYQLALDEVNRTVYAGDSQWRVQNAAGEVTTEGSGKLVEFDVATRSFVKNHSFLGLTRSDNTVAESEPLVTGTSSIRNSFSPYGVAVGTGTTTNGEPDPTIITTTARQRGGQPGTEFANANYGGGLVVYRASQGAPTDADRLWFLEDGSPLLNGPRRIAVNNQTNKAYVTNLGTATAPGFIAVIDLQTKTVDARVRIPAEAGEGGHQFPGSVGVAVDEANNLVYVGNYNGSKLFVIDGAAVNTSNPIDFTLNTAESGAIRELDAVTHPNSRPTYNAETKKLYVSSYPERGGIGVITVVDADPASATYGQEVHSIDTIVRATNPELGAVEQAITTNFVEVDGQRGLLYSADLGAREVVVYDINNNYQELLRLPTSGNALNLAIDPVTREVWVSNFSNTGKIDIFTVDRLFEKSDPVTGAKFYLPTEWIEGRPLAVAGHGWKNIPGDKGSTVAVKLNQGNTAPNPDLGLPGDGVWAVAQADDATGNWTAQVPFPGAANADEPFSAGNSYLVHLLTGSLGDQDVVRAPRTSIPVVPAS